MSGRALKRHTLRRAVAAALACAAGSAVAVAALVPSQAAAGTIVYDRSRTDEEVDRVRAEIWAMDEDGSNRRLLASTADNADVEKHGPAAGYVTYSDPSVAPKGRDLVFAAGAVGHSATACNPFGPLGIGCQTHFGFNVDGARAWLGGRLRDLTPRPLPCSNCSTFYSHPELLSGGGWVGWYEHYQGGDTPFSAYISRWVLGALGGGEPRFHDSPCSEDFDQGPFAAHPRNPGRAAFVACRDGGDGSPWGVFVANRDGTGLRQVASILVDEGEPALAWTAKGRGLIARIFDAADPGTAGLYLLDPRSGPGAQRPRLVLGEPAGVELRSPAPLGARRIAFSARQGSGDETTSDLWTVRARCRGCAFPTAARRLTKDGISANPDWTSVTGLGLAEVRSSRPRVRGGRVPISISCPAGGRACRGRLTVRAGAKATIARGRYRVPAGKSRRTWARLTAKGRALTRRRGRIAARVELRGSTGKRSSTKITLR